VRRLPGALVIAGLAALGSVLCAFAAPCRAATPETREAAASAYALTPPTAGGVEALDRALARLGTHRRLLVVGAHPDDEDTEILAYVARGLGGEAAYLSLTRGEGGQNLVGPDLGVGLGLVRSQELAAARRLDGARQYFTRAYDFGFTRSLDETFRKWPKQVLFEDAVRILRRFRPQVVVSIFNGTARDGHGQHQAAGVTAREAYRLAGDPAAFPSLAAEGLTPWSPGTLLQETGYWDDKEATTVVLQTGLVEPLSGRSVYQIAMASRSLHRSQDMGQLQQPGPNHTSVGWVEGGAGRSGTELFSGVDTRLRAMAAEVRDPGRRETIAKTLDGVEAEVARTRRRVSTPGLASAVPALARILSELRTARALLQDGDGGAPMLLDEKIALAEAALASAAEVTLDALSAREIAAPGEAFEVTASVWNAGPENVEVRSVTLESADGWRVEAEPPPAGGRAVAPGRLEEWKARATVPAAAAPTIPYFLEIPLRGDLYDWGAAPAIVRGEPFEPFPLTVVAHVVIGGETVVLAREVAYRLRDQAIGEVRRPARAVPVLEVAVAPDRLVWPIGVPEKRLEVTLTSNAARPVSGRLEMVPPEGWPAATPTPFSLSKAGERIFLDIALRAPVGLRPGRQTVRFLAKLDDGGTADLGIRLIDYGYIPRTPLPERSETGISAAELRFPPIRRLGYVRGAADRVPEALSGVGLPVEILNARELETGDLSVYDAILVGSRAYETDPALARTNARLLDYARNGGLLIVQYQQYPFVQGGFAPYTLEIARPHDRVTDESAAVTVLDPASPVFTTPNRIGPDDWAGWVQERGLYFARSWAPEFTPLLSMADPGGPGQKGALLAARVGKGRYVYTGLAFFRQLPAGVPGAYRLLANLLAWKATS
jgi:LmbE family N-acetylglucosaminyl deacetylase